MLTRGRDREPGLSLLDRSGRARGGGQGSHLPHGRNPRSQFYRDSSPWGLGSSCDQATYANDVTLGVAVTLPIFSQNAGPIAVAEASQREQQDVVAAHRLGIERDVRVLRTESAQRKQIAEHYAQAIAPVLSEHAALVKQALAGLELDVTVLLAAEDMVTRGGIEYLEARLAQRKAEISLSRALGEYGSVTFVSGNMPFKTEIAPVLIVQRLEEFAVAEATAIAVVLLVCSFLLLGCINVLERWSQRHAN